MEKDKKIDRPTDNSIDTTEEKVKFEDKIIDIFKIMLGYNWHEMGTKKEF